MPRSIRFIPIPAAIGVVGTLAALSVGCSSSTDDTSKEAGAQSHSASAGSTETPTPKAGRPSSPPSSSVPLEVERTAGAFTTAYAEHDARDGHDESYADAGTRAAKLASGELVGVLSQRRPSQDGPWAALRAEKARQTVKVTSAVIPDGAPAFSKSSGLVRVAYTLTTTPKSGQARHSNEHLVLRLEHASKGWRVAALPWA
jgi:hypothetical protein